MLYVIFVFLILCNLAFSNKGKISEYILVFSFLFMWVLNGWSSGGNDIGNYMQNYNMANLKIAYNPYTELFFAQSIYFARFLGLSYRQYAVIISTFETIVLYRFFKNNSKCPNISVALFMLYPMAYLFTLQRNLLAFTVLLVGGIEPLLHRKKHFKIRFLIFALIATLIHYSMAFYILLFVVDQISIKKTWIITLIGSILLSTASAFSFVLRIFSVYIDNDKIIKTLSSEQYGTLGRVSLLATISLQVFSVYWICNSCKKIDDDGSPKAAIYKLNVISLLTIPLTIFFSSSFLRVSVINLILFYSIYFDVIGQFSFRKLSVRQFVSFLAIFISIFAIIIMVYRGEQFREVSLYPMFEQNELLGFFLSS